MKKRTKIIIVVLLIAAAIGGYFWWNSRKQIVERWRKNNLTITGPFADEQAFVNSWADAMLKMTDAEFNGVWKWLSGYPKNPPKPGSLSDSDYSYIEKIGLKYRLQVPS